MEKKNPPSMRLKLRERQIEELQADESSASEKNPKNKLQAVGQAYCCTAHHRNTMGPLHLKEKGIWVLRARSQISINLDRESQLR